MPEKWYSEQFYHIYNRGHNHDLVFHNSQMYYHFFDKLEKHLSDYLDVLAFALIPNHFHLLVKLKSEGEIFKKYSTKVALKRDDIHLIIGNAFARFLGSYTKLVNKSFNLTGSLFEGKCKRKLIKNDEYLQVVIAYIHNNPFKHGILSNMQNFGDYKFSSFRAITTDIETKINRNLVLEIFDGIDNLLYYHNNYKGYQIENKYKDILFEQ